MLCLSQDFNLHKNVIIVQYWVDTKLDNIVSYLLDHYNFETSSFTLKQHFNSWSKCCNKLSKMEDNTLWLFFIFIKDKPATNKHLDTQLRFFWQLRLSKGMKRRCEKKNAKFKDLDIMRTLKKTICDGYHRRLWVCSFLYLLLLQ